MTFSALPGLLPWAGLLWLWSSFFLRVHLWWNEAGYYTHGWAVPFLALLLFTQRKDTAPAEAPALPDSATPASSSLLPALLSLALLFPLRLLAEPDPFWRLPLQLEALALVALTLALLRLLRDHATARAALLPCLLLLTTLPWPAFAESFLVQALTSFVTSVTAEALLWLGHPAEAAGHLIRVADQTILIDNACSGIRSFQSLLAIGFFLAVYFAPKPRPTLLVVAFSLFAAFLFNLCRALALSLLSLEASPELYEKWHDPIGHLAVTFAFLATAGFAYALRLSPTETELSGEAIDEPPPRPPLSPKVALLLATAALVPEIGAQTWFRLIVPEPEVPDWRVEWPVETSPIAEGVEDVLLFDYGARANIPLPDGGLADFIHFGYENHSAAASLCSRNHDPATCMGAYGVTLSDRQTEVPYRAGKARLVFRHYVAGEPDAAGRRSLHVYWCQWVEDPRSGAFDDPAPDLLDKARLFLSGKVSFRRKVLLVTLSGPRDAAQAEADLRAVLRATVRPAG